MHFYVHLMGYIHPPNALFSFWSALELPDRFRVYSDSLEIDKKIWEMYIYYFVILSQLINDNIFTTFYYMTNTTSMTCC